MRKKRRTHSADFKAKVVLEALKGLKTQNEIASQFEIHPIQISNWKKEFLKNASLVFGNQQAKMVEEVEGEKSLLFEKIGRLEIENDFLKKKLTILG
jgi:transposase-like protein